MPLNLSANELTNCSVQIVDGFGSASESDISQFHIVELHLIPRGGTPDDKVKCTYEMEDGRLVLKCRPAI